MSMDFNGLYETVLQKAYAAAEERVNHIVDIMQGQYDSMEMNDIAMSPYRNDLELLSKPRIRVEKNDNIHYSIVFEIPDGFSEKQSELAKLCFENAKQFALG